MLEKTWVKVVSIILAGLLVLGIGFWGVNAIIKNTSRSANSTESAKESSKEEKEEDLAWDKKLIVLMDNQKTSIAMTTQELRDGQYMTGGSAGPLVPETVSKITAEPLRSADLDTAVKAKKAELFKVLPYYRGSGTYLLVEPKKTTLFSSQNFNGETLDKATSEPKMSVTMTNEEMKKYYEKHEKELAPLVDKVHVDSKNKNANSKPTDKQESTPQEQKQEQAKPEKKVSDLSLKEQQALALLALPAEMYSNYGDINANMILAGTANAGQSPVSENAQVNFGGMDLKVDGDKYLLYLADTDMPSPSASILGYFTLNGDTVTYKTHGMRIGISNEDMAEFKAQGITDFGEMQKKIQDKRAQVKGTESLQSLYNQYKDDPKFEQMQAKIK